MQARERRVTYVSFALAFLYLLGKLTLANAQDNCLPEVGESGSLTSVALIIQTWETRSSNFHFSDPELLSSVSYTVQKSSEVSRVGGVNVRFYGKELCVAVTKVTETGKDDGSTDRSSVCKKSCFGVGGGTRLDTYSGSFGRITSTNPICCYWGRTTTLRFSIPAAPTTPPPSYECIKCGPADDCDGAGAESSTETCNPGEKCMTLKLQKKQTDEVVTIKGCSRVLRYWGKKLDCDYQCKNNVPLWPENRVYHYSVCVSCCAGNKCNTNKVSSGADSHYTTLLVMFATLVCSAYGVI